MIPKPTRIKKIPKPLKKKKTTPRAKLVKKCDDLVSLIVRTRDKSCVTCGSTESLGCGHLWSRVAYSTRWDLDNCHCQCWGCNFKHEYDPYNLEQYVLNKFGQDKYDLLHQKFAAPKKWEDFELEELADSLALILVDTLNQQ